MAAGQPYELFWRLTLREVDLVLQGEIERHRRSWREAKAQNYALAALVRVAFNDPKKFPKAEEYLRDGERRYAGEEELRAFFMARVPKKPASK